MLFYWFGAHKQCIFTDLLCSLLGAQICLILVGRRGQRAAGRLVQELLQALGVISHWAVVVPKCWAVARRHRLWTSCSEHQVILWSHTSYFSAFTKTDIIITNHLKNWWARACKSNLLSLSACHLVIGVLFYVYNKNGVPKLLVYFT